MVAKQTIKILTVSRVRNGQAGYLLNHPSGVPVLNINMQIINPPGPVLVTTHGKVKKEKNNNSKDLG